MTTGLYVLPVPFLLWDLMTAGLNVVVSSPKAEECFTKNDIIFAYRNDPVSEKLLNYNCTAIDLSPYCDYWRNLRPTAAVEILSQN